ncbi:MAG: RNA polymerase sigma factor [Planctomycetaceae bacterium]
MPELPLQPAWPNLFQQHECALVLFARRWADSHVDAEDMVQEAMVRVLRVKPSDVQDPLSYLYTCVRNVGNEFKRTLGRRTRREEIAATNRGSETWFECPIEERERVETLQAAIARLTDARQEVVTLKIWSGMTFPQIGDVLDISPNTAASRYRHALIEMKDFLSRSGAIQ